MSQSERDDYDDDHRPNLTDVEDLHRLKKAGTFWIFVWAWFLMGVCLFGGIDILTRGIRVTTIPVIGSHIILAIIFILVGNQIRKAKTMLLWEISFGSALLGIVYGGIGLFVGLFMSIGFLEALDENGYDGNFFERVTGVMLVVWAVLLNLEVQHTRRRKRFIR